MPSPSPDSPRKISAAGCGLAGLFVLLLILSGGLAFLGGGMLIDARQFGRIADFVWGLIALICAAMLFAGSIAALVHLKSRGPRAWRIGFVLFAAAAAINLLLAAIGMVMVAQARVRGGDWGALHVGVARVFGVFTPLLLAGLTAFAAACHKGLRAGSPPEAPARINAE